MSLLMETQHFLLLPVNLKHSIGKTWDDFYCGAVTRNATYFVTAFIQIHFESL